ncbi:MAG: sodium:proton exchanger [Epulopiscium sp. Nele67-Bin004]|nr:MAG: sodium:proton exchanger [Epulopiscium sp. Nele67-Bin004]
MGIISIIPIVLAIVLAIKTKKVIVSLFVSVFVGALLLHGFNVFASTQYIIKDMFVQQLTDSYNAGVIVLMLFIGGFIELMMKSGGAYAFAKSTEKHFNTKNKVQFGAFFSGIMIFFSDLGTPLIVGPVFEPFFKKLKISKEKLAFILDSTSSPVAVLVPFIGWGVFVIGLLEKEFSLLNLNYSAYQSFVSSIPFNLYSILAITIIPVTLKLGFEFKSMKKYDISNQNEIAHHSVQKSEFQVKNAKAYFVWLPILVLMGTLFGMLGIDFILGKVAGSMFRTALSSGYLYASVVLISIMLLNKSKTFSEIFSIYIGGMSKMTEVIIILVLAWTLGSVGKALGTSDFLVEFMKNIQFNGAYLPLAVFLLGSVISFAAGSSWGTFSILLPIVIPIAVVIDAPLFVTIGAVLSGGLFGDHVSPISDTTILSSAGAQCDHLNHVDSQMSYAVFNSLIASIFFLVCGFNPNPILIWVGIVVQVLGIIAIKHYYKINDKKEICNTFQEDSPEISTN